MFRQIKQTLKPNNSEKIIHTKGEVSPPLQLALFILLKTIFRYPLVTHPKKSSNFKKRFLVVKTNSFIWFVGKFLQKRIYENELT